MQRYVKNSVINFFGSNQYGNSMLRAVTQYQVSKRQYKLDSSDIGHSKIKESFISNIHMQKKKIIL